MVRTSTEEHCSGSPKRVTSGFLVSVSSLMALFSKQASRVSSKLKSNYYKQTTTTTTTSYNSSAVTPPKSPLKALPKQLITSISNKAIAFINRKNTGGEKPQGFDDEDDRFGDGGVWQRSILMGDKCQPLDFSGVIYYDSNGRQMNELPIRSPRASPLPGYLARK